MQNKIDLSSQRLRVGLGAIMVPPLDNVILMRAEKINVVYLQKRYCP